VYEYFLAQFASAEGKKGGQFYTPSHVVRILVEMLAPYKGRVYDPCCGSGGMFVSSEKFIEAHSGKRGESLKEDKRWVYGVPPAGNANFAWVQHFIYHLAPTGLAGFVLANGSMSSNQSGEGDIRKAIIEADLVDCMVALPGQLFYSTQIPVCLWFLARTKKNGRFRDRRGETLFIDAREMGTLVDRVHRELTDDDVRKISGTYHAWRGDQGAGEYLDVAGFCKAAKLEDIRQHGHLLTPGRY